MKGAAKLTWSGRVGLFDAAPVGGRSLESGKDFTPPKIAPRLPVIERLLMMPADIPAVIIVFKGT